ncbi:MAG: hypothetical protein QXG00_00265 [Candidatus Woesearchaeota archaeon]
MFNKRGDEEKLWNIFNQFAILMGIGLLVFAFVYQKSDNTIYWRNYFARDNALVIDSLEASPGKIGFVYYSPRREKDFLVSLKSSEIFVYDFPKQERGVYANYPFANDINIKIIESETSSKAFRYEYASGVLGIGIQQPLCDKSLKSVSETNFSIITLDQNLFYLSNSIENNLENTGFVKDINNPNLIIYVKNSPDEKLSIFYPPGSFMSKNLACELKYTFNNFFNTQFAEQNIQEFSQISSEKTAIMILIPVNFPSGIFENKNDFVRKLVEVIKNNYK